MDASLHSTSEVLEHYDSTIVGLSAAQVRKLQRKHGANELGQQRFRRFIKQLVEPLASLYMLVLIAAVVVSLAGGEILDASVIGAVIAINAVIAWSQSISSNRVLRSLRKLDARQVEVIRAGDKLMIPTNQLVPGDIMVLTEGVIIPADGRIISENNLEIDESSLTGESLPVTKHAEKMSKAGDPYTRTNMVFKGTTVQSGRAEVCVTSIGSATELGKIAKLTKDEDIKAPIQVKIDRLAKVVIILTAVLAVATFGLGIVRGYGTDEMIRFAIALCVSAIPEGLPVTLAIVLLLGVRAMAKRKALVRHLAAVETLGMITVIATDKTGTLTKNRLTVADTWSASSGTDIEEYAGLAISSHDKDRLEPLVKAIAQKYTAPKGWNEVGDLPFSDEERLSAVLWEYNDKLWAYVLGAPETVITASKLTPKQRSEAKKQLRVMTTMGYRVLAIGKRRIEKLHELKVSELTKLEFVGLIALGDEVRPESKGAISKTKAAGIRVLMLTGDHRSTALAIAQKLGIAKDNTQVMEGSELDKLAGAKMYKALQGIGVLARIVPEAKYAVVKALKGKDIIAMTGDGVNDTPALTQADIGIAMGSGTDAAKDAADMVLINDNFNTIVEAIKQGRTIYANIRKLIFYLLSSNLGEALTMVGALLIGLPLPLTAVQILWINLITDSAVGIPLGLEPEEEHFMRQAPRSPEAPLLGRVMVERLFLMAGLISTTALTVFYFYLPGGHQLAQTMAFYTLVVIQWANALNARSERAISLDGLKRPNIKLWLGLSIAIALQIIVGITPLRNYFGLTEIPTTGWWVLAGTTLLVIAVSDAHKLLRRNTTK